MRSEAAQPGLHGLLVTLYSLHFVVHCYTKELNWAMQVLLKRKVFHQHRINLMSSRAVMYELAHNYYVLIKLH